MGVRKPENEVPPPPGGVAFTHDGTTVYVYPDGRIWSVHHAKFMMCSPHSSGYRTIGIGKTKRKTFYVHILVLTLFDRPPQPGEEGRHLNGVPDHNWIDNLEWGTSKQNKDDQVEHGTASFLTGSLNWAKLTPDQVKEIRSKVANSNEVDLAAEYGITAQSVRNIIMRKTWRRV